MEKYYHNLRKQAEGLLFRFQDIVDRPDHPVAQSIKNELRRLEDDVQEKKRPRSIEDRLKTIQRQLLQAQHGNDQIMDSAHGVALHDQLERIRRDLRSLPEY